ncbi:MULTISPECIES: transporter substrate-binding domain-containing protein [Halomonadaceae]|uniref:transporter substrate-binding domain-containing protein n=1 Tax=Halomonadaceae TaxID=28256 RepID=UPI001598FCFC|nr:MULTISPECIES: transporter substrate-binding domain-containing protein [Halomonas]QJQ95874.1 transporter substrate-binding domain-containing protein [Halomonas sp. PA5]
MRIQTSTALFLSAALLGGIANADERPLRIGVDVPYEPYQYKLPDGTMAGFEVELVNHACERMQRECEWVEQPWDGIIPGLQARKYDFIASAMNITEERSRQVLFSEPYYQVPSVWVGKAGAEHDLEGTLESKAIGVQQGTIQDEYVTQFYPQAEIKRYGDSGSVVVDMHAGRLDLVFTAFPLAQETMLSDDRFARQGELVTGPESIYGPGIGAAFRQRDTDLVEAFNSAMAELKEDGTFDALYSSYFAD